jgi:hypothetical protein
MAQLGLNMRDPFPTTSPASAAGSKIAARRIRRGNSLRRLSALKPNASWRSRARVRMDPAIAEVDSATCPADPQDPRRLTMIALYAVGNFWVSERVVLTSATLLRREVNEQRSETIRRQARQCCAAKEPPTSRVS